MIEKNGHLTKQKLARKVNQQFSCISQQKVKDKAFFF
jgi:hypothetical protein